MSDALRRWRKGQESEMIMTILKLVFAVVIVGAILAIVIPLVFGGSEAVCRWVNQFIENVPVLEWFGSMSCAGG